MRLVQPIRAQAVQSSFDPVAMEHAAGRLPSIPTRTPAALSARNMGVVPQVPSRVPEGLRSRDVLPRALHALRRNEVPERAGAAIAQSAARRVVAQGFNAAYGLSGLGATPGCTSTGARVAQEIMSGTGALLAVIGGAVGPTPAPGTQLTTQQRNLAIASASVSMASGVYAGACEARTGTQTTSYASQAVQTSAGIFAQIQAARNTTAGATSTPAATSGTPGITPDQEGALQAQQVAQNAAGNPNNADGVGEREAPAASDNKTLYIAGGVVAAVLLGALLLK